MSFLDNSKIGRAVRREFAPFDETGFARVFSALAVFASLGVLATGAYIPAGMWAGAVITAVGVLPVMKIVRHLNKDLTEIEINGCHVAGKTSDLRCLQQTQSVIHKMTLRSQYAPALKPAQERVIAAYLRDAAEVIARVRITDQDGNALAALPMLRVVRRENGQTDLRAIGSLNSYTPPTPAAPGLRVAATLEYAERLEKAEALQAPKATTEERLRIVCAPPPAVKLRLAAEANQSFAAAQEEALLRAAAPLSSARRKMTLKAK